MPYGSQVLSDSGDLGFLIVFGIGLSVLIPIVGIILFAIGERKEPMYHEPLHGKCPKCGYGSHKGACYPTPMRRPSDSRTFHQRHPELVASLAFVCGVVTMCAIAKIAGWW
jgi:hypothetical protein